MKKTVVVLAVILMMLFASCASDNNETQQSPDNSQQTVADENKQNNDIFVADDSVFGRFTAKDLDGNVVDESIFAENKLTMVNLWGTFCGPCINEMPFLNEISKEYADRGLAVVGMLIDVTDNDGNVFANEYNDAIEIVAQTGVEYVNIVPTSDLMIRKVASVYTVPETIFIDSSGRQVGESFLGARSKEQWSEIINELLGEIESEN